MIQIELHIILSTIIVMALADSDPTLCIEGSFLFHDTCYECPASCFKCSDASGDVPFFGDEQCEMKCPKLFKWNSLSGACEKDGEAASSSFSSKCQNERCKTCDLEERCGECADGFIKVGWKCIKHEHKLKTIQIAKENFDSELSQLFEQSANKGIPLFSSIVFAEDKIFLQMVKENSFVS